MWSSPDTAAVYLQYFHQGAVTAAHCSSLITLPCLAVFPFSPRYMKLLCDSCSGCGVQALNIWHHCEFVSCFIMFSKLALNWQTFFKANTYLTFRTVWLTCVLLFYGCLKAQFHHIIAPLEHTVCGNKDVTHMRLCTQIQMAPATA